MLNTRLRKHQLAAVDAWRKAPGPGFALYMEQRTGKTLTALAIANELQPARLLIVCPRRVVDEWGRQIRAHLKVDWPCEFLIHTYGELADRAQRLKRWARGGLVIADESHRAKAPSTLYARRLRTVGLEAKHRLALSGTPMGQGLHDVWAQFRFLDPAVFGKLSDFRARYCKMGGFQGKKVIGFKRVSEFQRILSQHSFRVTLDEIQSTELRVREHLVKPLIGPGEEHHYAELESQLITQVRSKQIEAPLVVTLIMKLQQITGGFLIDDDSQAHRIGRTKLTAALRILKRKTKPVVICVRFKHELEMFVREARKARKTVQTVSGAGNFFDPENPADWIVFQIQSGIGIDVSCASEVLFYSLDYSFINHDQMRARVLFYNAESVTYHYIVLIPSIDTVILNAVRRKQNIVNAALEYYGETDETHKNP